MIETLAATLYPLLIMICGYILFAFLGIIAHEGGHLLCGLATGYRFFSFRILRWVWMKEQGRIVLRTSSSRFVQGQCLMAPPEKSSFHFALYLLGGGIANLLLAGGLFALLRATHNTALGMLLLMGVATNLILGVTNLLPVVIGGTPTDGMNLARACRSPLARQGLYLMLRVNLDVAQGKRYRDYDAEAFRLPAGADRSNFLVAYWDILEAARLEDIGLYAQSLAVYDGFPFSKLPLLYRNSVYLDFLYYYCVYDVQPEKARALYKARGMRRFWQSDQPAALRINGAYLYFVEGDRTRGRVMIEAAERQLEAQTNTSYAAMERDKLGGIAGPHGRMSLHRLVGVES